MATRMNLDYKLDCGLMLTIVNYSDWLTLNEVFVQQEYAALLGPLAAACRDSSSSVVLDLGANSGYFTAYVCDRLFAMGVQSRLKFILVEAAPSMARDLNSRLPRRCGSFEFQIEQGLAGRRSGSARLEIDYKDNGSHVAGVGVPSQTVAGVDCAYLDLERLLAPSDRIACIKADIEGSEFDLIQEYPQLLRRAQTLVIEFHAGSGDAMQAQADLRELGFSTMTPCKQTAATSTCLFTRGDTQV